MKHWKHPHTFVAGAATLGVAIARHGWLLLLIGFLLGVLVTLAFRWGGRLADRLNRAIPDSRRDALVSGSAHPCEGPECNVVVYGRRRYCSQTCKEIAREERYRRQVHAERIADAGEVPF